MVGGGQGAYSEQVRAYISANGLQTRIVFLSGVADTDLPTLYRRAAAFVYPSHYEGFGIPIIEALFSQTPVITGTQMALREAAGEQSLCVDVREPAHIAEAMAQVLSDTALANTMRQAGLAHAERFLPQGLAQQLMGLYERLL